MIRSVLCDLGNVLLRFDHMQACQGFSRMSGLDPKTVYKRVFQSGIESDYDLGRVDSIEFARRVADALGCDADARRIQPIWSDIFKPIEGMESLIRLLGRQHRLVLLSNTNPWHFDHCMARFPWLECFDAYTLSYQVGLKKPDPDLFARALAMAETRPDDTVFIDDIQAYVDGALRLGIKSICFKGKDPLKSELRALGMDPGP
ncbi:MAG: HAD family phosphatase [Planctomycetes bacterium]|nr:HAD family phosphatase [Planctomycetota bacterium]